MKTILKPLLVFLFFGLSIGFAQEGIGTNNPDPSAALDVNSTTMGLLIPRMTTVQREAINSPAEGLRVYDTDTKDFWYFDGTVWVRESINGDLWVLENPQKVALDFPNGNDSIYYTPSGFKSLDKGNTIFEQVQSDGSVTNISTADLNVYDQSRHIASNISIKDADDRSVIFDKKDMIVDDSPSTTSNPVINGNSVNLVNSSSNSNDITSLYANQVNAVNLGTGTVSNQMGTFNQVSLGVNSNTSNNIWGSLNQVTFASDVASTNNVYGTQGYVSLRGNGTINNVSGIYSVVNQGFRPSAATVSNMYGFQNNITFGAGFTGQIDNYYDFYARATNSGSGTISNKYGFYILGSDKVSFVEGKLGIGTNTPQSTVQIWDQDGDQESALQVSGAFPSRAHAFASVNGGQTIFGGNLKLNPTVSGTSHDGFQKGTDLRGAAGILMNNTNNGRGNFSFLISDDTNDDTYTVEEIMSLLGTGQLRLQNYGIGTFNAAPSAILGVSSNGTVVETSINDLNDNPWDNPDGSVATQSSTNINYINGNVGIGTTTPAVALQVNGENGFPATTGTDANAILRLNAQASQNVMDFGVDGGSSTPWIQGTRRNDLSVNTKIALNPNGGRVGVGTVTPQDVLHINGTNTNIDALRIGSASRPAIRLEEQDGNADENFQIQVNNGLFGIGIQNDAFTGYLQALNIDKNRNVGIKETSPLVDFQVNGTILANGVADFAVLDGQIMQFGEHDGTTFTENMSLSANGQLRLNNYGAGSFSGTTTNILAVTANGTVIEEPLSGLNNNPWDNPDGSVADQSSTDINYMDGNVGIGTTSPNNTLTVEGNGAVQAFQVNDSNSNEDVYMTLNNTTTTVSPTTYSYLRFEENDATAFDIGYAHSSQTLMFENRGAVSNSGDGLVDMAIDVEGRMGIGTTSPTARLDVRGNGTDPEVKIGHGDGNIYATIEGPTNRDLRFDLVDNGATDKFQFRAKNATAGITDLMVVEASGNVGIGTTAPDANLEVSGTNPNLQVQNTTGGTASTDRNSISLRNDGFGADAKDFIIEQRGNIPDVTAFRAMGDNGTTNQHTFMQFNQANGHMSVGGVAPSTASLFWGRYTANASLNTNQRFGYFQMFNTGTSGDLASSNILNLSNSFRDTYANNVTNARLLDLNLDFRSGSSGTITNAFITDITGTVEGAIPANTSMTISDLRGLNVNLATIDDLATNAYGLYINNISGANGGNPDNNYAIYTNGGAVRLGDLQDDNSSTNKVVVADANGVLKTSDAVNLTLSSPLRTETSDYTAVDTDGTILVDASSNTVTITLPTPSLGRKLMLKKIDNSRNLVTISGGAALIDGAATRATDIPYQSFLLQSDGTNWYIMN